MEWCYIERSIPSACLVVLCGLSEVMGTYA